MPQLIFWNFLMMSANKKYLRVEKQISGKKIIKIIGTTCLHRPLG